jgi:Protein of unknown function (DUF3300)
MMDEQLDWTENLGNAVAAQQPDVMDAIQRLRYQAAAAGTLWSNAQQRVTTERQVSSSSQPIRSSCIRRSTVRPAFTGPGHIRTTHRSIYPHSEPTSVSRAPSESGLARDLLWSDRYGAGAFSIGPSVGYNSMLTV